MGLNKCCCCIPLRAGVMLIALVSSAFYIASLVFLLLRRNDILSYNEEDTKTFKAVFWSLISVVGLYSISSLFGVVGSVTQNRRMTALFKVLYWIMAVLMLVISVAAWALVLSNQDVVQDSCIKARQQINTSVPSYYTPVQVPSGAIVDENSSVCASALKSFLIISGVLVFVGNFIQIYFASAISAYASRLKRNNKHQQLRDLDDYPEVAQKSTY